MHNGGMTELLEQAVATARTLPPEMQDDIARMVLAFADAEREPVLLSADERAAIERSKAAAARGEFATDEDVKAMWASYGL